MGVLITVLSYIRAMCVREQIFTSLEFFGELRQRALFVEFKGCSEVIYH
jgi:hypothetical protein